MELKISFQQVFPPPPAPHPLARECAEFDQKIDLSFFLHLVPFYRVTHQDGKNLPLAYFRQSRQLVGHYCCYLLPR